MNPDEIGRMLARIDDRNRPGYPGLLLALIPGEFPLLARRVNYFESARFGGYFGPHPDHPPPPTLAERARLAAQQPKPEPAPLPIAPPQRPEIGLRIVWSVIGALVLFAIVVAFGVNHSGPSSAPAPSTAARAPNTAASAYSQGAADWRALQAWFAKQTDERRAGADWWAANRSHNPKPCWQAAKEYTDDRQARPLFEFGCLDAKSWLDMIDAKRADPQYKAGFNDEAKR